MKKFFTVLLVVIFICAALASRLLYAKGEFMRIAPHFKGTWHPLAVIGPEDIAIDHNSGMAFISSDDRRAAATSDKPVRGAIYGLDLNSPSLKLVELTKKFPFALHPHGISLWQNPDDSLLLFVINHRSGAHKQGNKFVEVFQYKDGALEYQESIEGDSQITNPNDLAAVGPRQFYISNDHGNTDWPSKLLEDSVPLSESYVLFYDGKSFRKVAQKLAFANGVALSPDKKRVYVAAATGDYVRAFDRNPETGDLAFSSDIVLGTGPDNIDVDEAGCLWSGCHPKKISFLLHALFEGRKCPAQIVRIIPGKGAGYTVEEVFLDDGAAISGATVAAAHKGRMLIGSSFDDHLLVCEFKRPGRAPVDTRLPGAFSGYRGQ